MKSNKVLAMFLLLALSFAMPKNLKSQIVEIGATGGLSYYWGDLNPAGDMNPSNSVGHFSNSKPSFGGVIRYYQNLRWAFRLQYSRFNLESSGEAANLQSARNLAFKSKVNDAAFIVEFNFFDYWTGSRNDYFSPYIFAGVSMFTFESTLDGRKLQSSVIKDVRYNTHSMSVPFGVGVKYGMSEKFGVTLELKMHKAFTDYLDGVVDNIREVAKIEPFRYKCDWIGSLELTIVYRFNLPRNEVCHYM